MSNHSLGFKKLGIDLATIRGRAGICPNCSEGRKKKNQRCLSVNIDNGYYNCNHCDFSGRADSNKWITKSDNEKFKPVFKTFNAQRKVYNKPTLDYLNLSEKSIEWFLKRGITKATLDKNKVAENKSGDIAFRYFNDDEFVACKFRKANDEKQFYQLPNCKPILYKLNDIKKLPYAIICEGEMDALSWSELGLDGAVSIDKGAPNAGSNVGSKLDCLKMCYRFLEDKEDIYISVDNDENGKYLQEILIDRFGRHKCQIIEYPKGCKDANDVLMQFGKEGLERCFNNCKRLPVNDVQTVDDVWDEIESDWHSGVDSGEYCGFDAIKDNFSWIKGFLYLWSGIPNHGKSAFLSFMMILKSLQDGTKWAVFSPEHAPAKEFYKGVIKVYTGKSFNKAHKNHISLEELQRCKSFIQNHFLFIYPEDPIEIKTEEQAMQTPKWILEKITELVVCEGVKGIVIDPWNQLDHIFRKSEREDQYLSHWFKRFKKIAQMHNLYMNIVAHPKGMTPDKNGVIRKPTAYDISGGAMWNNKFDVITMVHRPNFYTDKMDTTVLIDIQKAKKQYMFGRPDEVKIEFEVVTNWYKDVLDPSPLEGVFDPSILNQKKIPEDDIFDKILKQDLAVSNLAAKEECIEPVLFEVPESKEPPMKRGSDTHVDF